jgi:uncharacterized membrane protein
MFWTRKSQDTEVKVFEVREARATVFIEAPPQEVWDCVSDISSYDKWVRWFRVIVPEGQPRLEKRGDYFDYETTILGIKFTGRLVALERIAPQRSAYALLSTYRAGGEYLFEPILSGTRVHYTIWSEIPSSYMGKAIDQVLLAKNVQEQMQDHLNRLKAYVEGTALP